MTCHTPPSTLAAGAAPAPAPAGDDLEAVHRALRREVARGPAGLPAARILLRAALAAWWDALAPNLPLRPAPADPAAQRGRRGASGGPAGPRNSPCGRARRRNGRRPSRPSDPLPRRPAMFRFRPPDRGPTSLP